MRRIGLLAFIGLALLGLGLSIGVAVHAPPRPPSLGTAAQPSEIPVAQRAFDDARTVSLEVPQRSGLVLTTPTAGRVVALNLTPGERLSSGQHALTLNDTKVWALATAEPLWRDLVPGDSGSDVAALQAELVRLGHPAGDSAVVDAQTLRAVAGLQGITGPAVPQTIPLSAWLWIPSAEVSIAKLMLQVGSRVEEGTELATLIGETTRLKVVPPADAVPGERVIEIGEQRHRVDGTGAVTDPEAVAAILTSQEYEAARAASVEGQAVTLKPRWVLTEPVEVTAVPPAALTVTTTRKGCVVSGGQTVAVQVVSSELGQALVTSQTRLTTVTTPWPNELTCP